MAVGGVGAAPAEAAAEVDGGIEPMGNPSFHCSNISSGFFSPFLPGGDKDPIRGGSTAGRQAGRQAREGGREERKEGRKGKAIFWSCRKSEQRPKMHTGRVRLGEDVVGNKANIGS